MPPTAKAAVDALVATGRSGYERRAAGDVITITGPNGPEEHTVPGDLLESKTAAEARAVLLTEHRRYLARLNADPDAEASAEAAAGAILEAETAVEIHRIHEYVKAWIEAHR